MLRSELWGTAGAEQEARREHDPWDDVLVEVVGTVEQGQERVFSRDLLETVLGIPKGRLLDRDSKRLAACMRRLGWRKADSMRIGNRRTSGYFRDKT